MNETEV